MSLPFVDECTSLLQRTPLTLDALLRGLPESLVRATDGPDTWSAFDVVGHLLYGERDQWLGRARIILQRNPEAVFPIFDREAMLRDNVDLDLGSLLDGFAEARARNVAELQSWNVQQADLELTAKHPAVGAVTLKNVLAMWTGHDMAHLLQISRTLAHALRPDVGPFAQFTSVMRPSS